MKKRKLWISILAGLLAAVMVFGLLSAVIPLWVDAAPADELEQQIDDLEKEKAELDKKIRQLRDRLSENNEQIEQLLAQKELIDQQIFLLHQEQQLINEQIDQYNILIAQQQEKVDAAQARLDAVNQRNKARIRAMEKQSKVTYWSVIFHADSLIDMLDRINTIQKIATADQQCLDEYRRATEEVTQAKAELEEKKAVLEQKKAKLEQNAQELEQKSMEADALLAQAVAQSEEYERLISASEEKQDALMDEIAQKEADYNTATKPATPPSNPGGASNVKWLVPCNYVYLSSPFGNRYHPLTGVWKLHKGVDLAAPEGTPIRATRSGYVTKASYEEGGAGYYVSINHGDGYASIYMHMTHYIVSAGQYVEQGQVIGYVGSTGGSTGNHLHFGISYNGTYVNPADFMKL